MPLRVMLSDAYCHQIAKFLYMLQITTKITGYWNHCWDHNCSIPSGLYCDKYWLFTFFRATEDEAELTRGQHREVDGRGTSGPSRFGRRANSQSLEDEKSAGKKMTLNTKSCVYQGFGQA